MLAAAYTYTDFGETAELTGSNFDNEICYTGAVYDDTTGLYYMNARYYDPANGRFISQDTYRGELDTLLQWHLYAYCANNPVNYVDPSGHLNIPGSIVAGVSMFVLQGLKIVPTKKKHFSRNKDYDNEKKDLPQTETDAKRKGWDKQSDANSACHQFNATKGHKNRKYLSTSKHKEAVYKYNKKKRNM